MGKLGQATRAISVADKADAAAANCPAAARTSRGSGQALGRIVYAPNAPRKVRILIASKCRAASSLRRSVGEEDGEAGSGMMELRIPVGVVSALSSPFRLPASRLGS